MRSLNIVLKRTIVAIVIVAVVLFTTLISVQANTKSIEPHISDEVLEIVKSVSAEYGIADSFVIAIIESESGGKVDAYNSTYGSIGLMQIIPGCHKDILDELGYTADDLWRARPNVEVGCAYLLELFETYDDPYVVLGFYHGERNVLDRADRCDWSGYQKKVMERSDQLELMKGAKG